MVFDEGLAERLHVQFDDFPDVEVKKCLAAFVLWSQIICATASSTTH